MTTTTTELEPVSSGLIALARKDDVSLAELAGELVPAAEPTEEAQPFPKLPKPVELTPPARTALNKVARVFGCLTLKDRRSLTKAELESVTDEAVTLSTLQTVLSKRLDELKEFVRIHIDVDAEERGMAIPKVRRGIPATQRDRKGHYLLAEPESPLLVQVEGFTKPWQQRFVSGGTKTGASPAELLALYEEGTITREEYLAVTSAVRAYDPDKTLAFVRKNPERGLAILRRLTTREEPNSALYLPER